MMANNYVEEELDSVIRFAMDDFSKYSFMMRYPDVRDGLKPIHRRILVTMDNCGLDWKGNTTKCARVVGDCMRLHPHGDASIYGTLVAMAQPFTTNVPMVQGQGNFGNALGDGPAAQRYTECKLSKYASKTLVKDLNPEVVEYIPNYDNTISEPVVLPAMLPNLIINGSYTIGGAAFNASIPPHNISDVIDICVSLIKRPGMSNAEIGDKLLPDFSGGGILLNPEEIKAFYKHGTPTSIKMTCKYEINEAKRVIVITELPYLVDGLTVKEEINKKFPKLRDIGIESIIDVAIADRMQLEIYYTKTTNPHKLIELLKSRTRLTSSAQLIIACTINDRLIESCDMKTLFTEWLAFRRDTLRRIIIQRIQKMVRETHVLEALVRLYDKLDEIIDRIKKSGNKADVVTFLQKDYGLSVLQANAIAGMKLYELSRQSKQEMTDRMDYLTNAIREARENLDEKAIDALIISQLKEAKTEFGRPRRTTVLYENERPRTGNNADSVDLVLAECTMNNVAFARVSDIEHGMRAKLLEGQRTVEVKRLHAYNTVNDILFAISNFGLVYRVDDVRDIIDRATVESKKWERIVLKLSPRIGEEVESLFVISKDDFENDRGSVLINTEGNVAKRILVSDIPKRINKNGCVLTKQPGPGDPKILRVSYLDSLAGNVMVSVLVSGHIHAYNQDQFPLIGRSAKGLTLTQSPLQVISTFLCGENDKIYTIRGDGHIEIIDVSSIPKKRPNSIPPKILQSGNVSKECNRIVGGGRVGKADQRYYLLNKDGSYGITKADPADNASTVPVKAGLPLVTG
jgi:DNA gyrase subunit A